MRQLLQLPAQSATRNQAALEDMLVVVRILSTQAKAGVDGTEATSTGSFFQPVKISQNFAVETC